MTLYNFTFGRSIPDNFNFQFGAEHGVTTIPLNIGTTVLDIWNDNYYLLVCTTQGAECLSNRTFESLWYFESTIIQSICSNQEKVCFGTVSSGLYYNNFPTNSGNLGNGFLDECKTIILMTSSGIVDICSTDSGFFSGGENGVDILKNKGADELEVICKLTCSGINSVEYSVDTGMYYWSTANTVYSAPYTLLVKEYTSLDNNINNINMEHLNSEDVIYANTVSGIVRVFSSTCTGTIDNRNIIDSDYVSGNCGAEKIWEGINNKVIELDTVSGTSDDFLLNGDVSCLLYYLY